MSAQGKYRRWIMTCDQVDDLDALHARDLLIECFMQAQSETFARVKQNMGLATDEATLRRSVVGAVRAAFDKTGGDFSQPTALSLRHVVDSLAQSASAMGTPSDIIEHHRSEMMKVIVALEASEA